jgi:hypothetical protein
MPISLPTITTAISRLGPAEVFIGNPLVAGGMTGIGMLQGDRRGEIEFSENKLTIPEYTGDIPHDIMKSVSKANIVCSIVLNGQGAAIWPKISPLGSNAGGNSNFKRAPTTGVLLIPRAELGASLTWDTTGTPQWKRTEEDGTITTGAAAAPVNALWLWKATVMHGNIPYAFAEGGKSIVDVTFEGMLDFSKPEGAKIYVIGDPRALTPTPILVLP